MIPKVYVAECDVGRGVFAARHFSPGDLIFTFRGVRVDREDPIHLTPQAANLLQTGKRTYLDLVQPGLLVNHSCNPNAGVSQNRRLIALREIRRDEEIRFDYSTTMDDGIWSMECKCGDAECRSRIEDFRRLPPDVQAKYLCRTVVAGFIARSFRQPVRHQNGSPSPGPSPHT